MADDEEERDFDQLPVCAFKDLLLEQLSLNRILLVVSETGSGKTTQLPQFCLDSLIRTDSNKLIGVTQPRRVAAITVAYRVSEERHQKVGNEVGYTVRFDDCTSNKTRLKYMTDGVLLRECLSDPLLSRYQVIMLDEAHGITILNVVYIACI